MIAPSQYSYPRINVCFIKRSYCSDYPRSRRKSRAGWCLEGQRDSSVRQPRNNRQKTLKAPINMSQ